MTTLNQLLLLLIQLPYQLLFVYALYLSFPTMMKTMQLHTGSWFFSLGFVGFDGFDSFFLSFTPIRKNKVI